MFHGVAFISHGGGPMPLLGDPQHAALVGFLRDLPARFKRPKAVVVISAHWEGDAIGITSADRPELLFDYYGFPEASYRYQYPCPGAPALAVALSRALEARGFATDLNAQRGLDHGVFVPMMLMYPNADVPVVQVSLSASLDPAEHIKLGQALGALDEEGVLFIGSGFSYHNMRGFFDDSAAARDANLQFEVWLQTVLSDAKQSPEVIQDQLVHWHQAPGAQACHPREEHLMPLHVCFGIAGRAADESQSVEILNKSSSNWIWLG